MASNDPGPWTATATTVTAVEHTEGTSYLVAVGDPAAFPFPGSDHYHCRDFPAAGGDNLSARERARLRDYAKSVRRERRMPTILARQLIIRKVDKKKLHGQLRRLVYGLFMPESDELFRVVVSFL